MGRGKHERAYHPALGALRAEGRQTTTPSILAPATRASGLSAVEAASPRLGRLGGKGRRQALACSYFFLSFLSRFSCEKPQ